MRRSVLAVAGALLALVLTAPAHAGRTIDYLYVEANEVGGSGGHAAIRFGDRVFHFQWLDGGVLGVSREDFASFRRHYALVENRTIHAIRIPVSDETFDLIHGQFARRRLIEHQHFQILDALAADQLLLETVRAVDRGEPSSPVTVEGAGYFVGSSTEAAGAPSTAIENLRGRITAAHGPGFLDTRRAEIERQMDALDPRDIEPPPMDVSMERAPPSYYGFAQRYHDAVAALQALEVIRTAPRLLPQTRLALPVALDEDDRRATDALIEALAQSLVRLARSDRPDWGPALLVGLARLEALDLTRQTGAWQFLDVFPPDAPRVDHRRLVRRPDLLPMLLREARRDFEAARARIVRSAAGGFRELDVAALEAAGNRFAEALRAIHEGADLRLFEGRQVPTRRAPLSPIPVPPRAAATTDDALAVVAQRQIDYAARLHDLYRYRLFTRNCVTEIFQEIDRALGGSAGGLAALRESSRERLGGHLEMSGLRFIPAVSAAAAVEVYRVSDTVEIPSYRRASLARLYRDESPLLVFLRESNILTSTLYDGHPADSAFLFFTEDAAPVRPLFGVANLLTGLGATLTGVATLPFDHGRILWAGVKGIAFSVPELFFVNLRKGSFHFARDGAE